MNLNMKFDWNDISIVPAILSDISSRNEVDTRNKDNKLPLFTAPMDMVISAENVDKFYNSGLNITFPRHIKYDELKNDNYFYSYGLDEIIEILDNQSGLPPKVLIDIANGHMRKLYDTSKRIKELYGDNIELMIGNIANPETYRMFCDIGVDYCRISIGSGNVCTTSSNTSVHYPTASLVNECYEISKIYRTSKTGKYTKIIADGGFRNFSDIIKALALGSDYVMIGSILSKTFESCSDFYIKDDNNYKKIIESDAEVLYSEGIELYKYYRGMSTKEVQKFWNKKELKTSEGISKYNKVEYTLDKWVDNLDGYLRSTMSYCNKRTLDDFIGKAEYVFITQNAFNRFNK